MTANADIVHGDGERRHLPECDLAKQCRNNVSHDDSGYGDCLHCGQVCECDRLRACEQRVRQEIDREAFVLDEGDPFRQAYRRGLDAAREAVAAAYDDERYAHSDDWGVPVVYKDLMLAAIDALKEKP